jgi:hypothetical protein
VHCGASRLTQALAVNKKRVTLVVALVTVLALSTVAVAFWAQHMAYSEMPYNATKAGLISLEMKIQAFHLDTHALPHTLQDLVAPGDFKGWLGPYAKERDTLDVWGRPIGYEALDPAKPKFRLYVSPHNGSPAMSETYEP